MRNILDKGHRKNQNTCFILNNFFFPENRALYEVISTNMVESERLQMKAQSGAYELHAGSARLHARTYMQHPRARTSTRARVRTQRHVTLIAF